MQYAEKLISNASWSKQVINTTEFLLFASRPELPDIQTQESPVLTIYIEGNGLAWESKSRVSQDPTPTLPVALQLALKHPDGAAAYLARPCQYIKNTQCKTEDWTNARFSDSVIEATDQAISLLKTDFAAKNIRLIGYSGGGAVAALVAARRNDVLQLITIAGNLDHKAWTTHHRISPLLDSLNPVDAWGRLGEVEQVHLIGGKDKIVGEYVLASFLEYAPEDKKVSVIHFPGQGHQCCWSDIWQDIYQKVTDQSTP